MQHARYPEVDVSFGNWLAGLIDGEGHFGIVGQAGTASWHFHVMVGLRADDRPLLEEIQRRTALGRLYHMRCKDDPNPQVRWDVYTKPEVTRAIQLLDRFPLRSKKARDYAIWREACIHWISRCVQGGKHNDYGPIIHLSEQLRAIRNYSAPEFVPVPITHHALTLFS